MSKLVYILLGLLYFNLRVTGNDTEAGAGSVKRDSTELSEGLSKDALSLGDSG